MKSNPPHEDPVAHSGHASSVSHLRGLLEVTRLLRADEDLESLLNACARTVSESLGFATVVITLYRTAWNDFEVVSVHGSDAAREVLMGAVREWADWEPLLDERFHRCGAYFIEHDSFDWESVEQTSFIPEIEPSDDPDAWHPEDALIVPLHGSSPHPLGFVSVDEPASGKKPTDSELEVLVAVAAHAALAVEAAQEAVLAARHRDALDQLLRVSAQLTDSDSIESILAAVCDGIRSALGFQKVSIDLPEPDTGRLRARAAVGWDATDEVLSVTTDANELRPLLDPRFEVEGCYLVPGQEARRLLNRGQSTYSSVMNGRGPHAWNHHWLLVPLHDREGELIGMIWADDPEDRLIPSRDRLQALRTFANQTTTALASMSQFEEMRFLANHDPLTRLGNRRAFMSRLELETSRALRYGSSFALVVCDLDGFKEVNDRFGHLAGDEALEHVAEVMRNVVRGSDGAYRLGGDEFGLILVETGEQSASEVVGRVRSALVGSDDEHLSALRASFGVAVCPDNGVTPGGLFNAADQAMYEAKRLGQITRLAFGE
jgi:diguanylate cyclase (GGDEF)-like protein